MNLLFLGEIREITIYWPLTVIIPQGIGRAQQWSPSFFLQKAGISLDNFALGEYNVMCKSHEVMALKCSPHGWAYLEGGI